ncbi:MAG TPA: VTT domain-containing protein [Mariprofundaceae bacterium]|nr:VTT domain-containing protein [Mariprofundaceae bacterium]
MKRILPVVLLLVGLALFFAFHLDRFISLEALAHHRADLIGWVGQHRLLAPLAYIVVYIVVVAFSLPVATVMTLAGGFLFGAAAGTLYAVSGATIGATLLFLIAKTSVGDLLLAKAGGGLKRMQQGFADNALSYLLVLRLIPLFPFFLVNLAPAFLGVSLRVYVFATFFGIMPAGFVYALAGAGIGDVLDQGGSLSVSGILTPQILGALAGLAVLALLPVAYKRFRRDAAMEKSDV